MKKLLAITILLVITVLMTQAYAASGGGRFTKYSFGNSSSSASSKSSTQETSTKQVSYHTISSEPRTTPSDSSNDTFLTTMEEEIFEWLTNSISKFYNPSSVRVIEVMGIKDDMYYLAISAATLGGGTSNRLYELRMNSCQESKFATISKIDNTHFTLRDSIYGRQPYSSECDVGNINHALCVYCEQKGWN